MGGGFHATDLYVNKPSSVTLVMMVRGSLEVCATGSCCLGTISLLFTFDLFGAVSLVPIGQVSTLRDKKRFLQYD